MVADVAVLAPHPVKPESVHHSIVYGVAANPAPESVDAVHVQAGVESAVGVVVDGVPGVVGAVVSISTLPFEE